MGCIGTNPGETRLCPVCDSEIDADARECYVCQSDLRVFDVESDLPRQADAQRPQNLDALIDSITRGKEKPDLFEDIKNVGSGAKSSPGVAAPGGPATIPEPAFECPACGAKVSEDARECPKCRVQFSDEGVEEFECPACGVAVSQDAASCPGCGVRFAPKEEWAEPTEAPRGGRSLEPSQPVAGGPTGFPPRTPVPEPAREVELRSRIAAVRNARSSRPPAVVVADQRTLYAELPKLVNSVKPLLLGAKAAGVEIAAERRLINEAIASGKARDIEKAMKLVTQAKVQLEDAFTAQLADRTEALVTDLERARAEGGNLAPVVPLIAAVFDPLGAGQYLEAADRLAAARKEFEARASGYHRAREALAATDALLEDARSFGIDTGSAAELAQRGRDALSRKDWDAAARFGGQGQDEMRKVLPKAIEGEMKRARDTLVEMKVRGADLARPIGILKQASLHLKRQEFAEALRYLRQYRQEVAATAPFGAR